MRLLPLICSPGVCQQWQHAIPCSFSNPIVPRGSLGFAASPEAWSPVLSVRMNVPSSPRALAQALSSQSKPSPPAGELLPNFKRVRKGENNSNQSRLEYPWCKTAGDKVSLLAFLSCGSLRSDTKAPLPQDPEGKGQMPLQVTRPPVFTGISQYHSAGVASVSADIMSPKLLPCGLGNLPPATGLGVEPELCPH